MVEVALELVQEDRAYHCCGMMQKKPIVDISNKKGMDSEKLPKDQIFLKACQTYHATLESWISKSIAKAKEWTDDGRES